MARKRFKPLTPFDVADHNPTVIARRLHALQRDMRDGFEMLANQLTTRLEAHEVRLERLEDPQRRRRR